jgi:hypothetical protein
MDQGEHRTANAAWAAARPVLSILIPFHRDDPLPLLAALEDEAATSALPVEIVLLDDGGGDEDLAGAVEAQVRAMRTPALFLRLERNEGRARSRNRLGGLARGGHLLFVDSDLAPDRGDFLRVWLDVAAREVAVACGGSRVDRAPAAQETELHRAMAGRSDCLSAAERRRAPAKYFYSNNLLVRKDVFAAEPFDEGYVGWGWEDVDLGLRLARRWPIEHIDNPTQNGGLDTVEGLLSKYEQAAPNFARVLASHPREVQAFPVFRVAKALKRVPLRELWAPVLKALARGRAPLKLRAWAMKAYRASLYARVI